MSPPKSLWLFRAPSKSHIVHIFNRLLSKFGLVGEAGVSVDEHRLKINLRKSIILIALAIVLMGIAAWLLTHENFYQMFAAIRGANGLLIASAIAIYYVSVAVWAARWQTALCSINCGTSFGIRYSIICAAIFLNNITPVARVGGDPFGRVYMLHKLENKSYSAGMASSIGEHALTPLVIISFLMAGLFLQFGGRSIQLSVILAVAWAVAALGTIFLPRLFFKKRIAAKVINSVIKRVLSWFRKRENAQAIMRGIETFYASSYATIDKLKKVLVIGSLTLLIGALEILRIYTIFLALGYHPQISMLLIAASLPTIVGLIPFLPGGLILVEGSFISIFALFGVPLNLALAATLIERGISFVLSTIVGAVVFSYLGVRMARKAKIQTGA
jgi:uncharacterized protein (TIRG00374 family)